MEDGIVRKDVWNQKVRLARTGKSPHFFALYDRGDTKVHHDIT